MKFGFEFANYLRKYDFIKTLRYVIVPVKFCLNVGNNEYITLCKFGGRIVSSCEVLESSSLRPQQAKKARSAK